MHVPKGGTKIIQERADFPPNSSSCLLDVEVDSFQGSNRSRLSTCSKVGYPWQNSTAVCDINESERETLTNISVTSSVSNHQPVIGISMKIQTRVNTPESVVLTFICNKSQEGVNDRYHGEYHFNYSTTG